MTFPGWTARKRQGPASPMTTILRHVLRAGLSVALSIGFLWLLADRWAAIDTQALSSAFANLTGGQWLAALALTAASFWAVGRYDAVLHSHFATRTPPAVARRAGVCAIAVSQTLGLGLISGAILRWRMLPEISLWQATRLTAAVALSFLASWAVVTSMVLVVLPDAPYRAWAFVTLCLALAVAGFAIAAPQPRWLRWRLPNGFTLTRLLGLCAIDTLAASLAFMALLPAGLDLPYASLLPAFLLALGAGLALGTPGGMGAFEVTLIALLPTGESPELLAAILAWRLVYYALPAVIGAGIAIIGPAKAVQKMSFSAPNTANIRAETGLDRQGTLTKTGLPSGPWLMGRSGHSLLAVFDPITPQTRPDLTTSLQALHQLAKDEGRLPVVYKSGPRLTALARRQGKSTRRIAWEAWIAPQTYQLATSCRAGLRRKLRRAEAAGITIRHTPAEIAPWPALDQIAADWAQSHGGERGFSMGRHARAYLAQQRLYVAWRDDRPIAYVSFHTTAQEWALDLMRHQSNLPDGTMHALIQTAITDAARHGISRLSLAAVPDAALGRHDLTTRLMAAVAPEIAADGLYRFKSSFAPRWRPLYMIASNPVAMAVGSASLWRAITAPPPLTPTLMPEIEQDDAEYGFALDAAPWHIAVNR